MRRIGAVAPALSHPLYADPGAAQPVRSMVDRARRRGLGFLFAETAAAGLAMLVAFALAEGVVASDGLRRAIVVGIALPLGAALGYWLALELLYPDGFFSPPCTSSGTRCVLPPSDVPSHSSTCFAAVRSGGAIDARDRGGAPGPREADGRGATPAHGSADRTAFSLQLARERAAIVSRPRPNPGSACSRISRSISARRFPKCAVRVRRAGRRSGARSRVPRSGAGGADGHKDCDSPSTSRGTLPIMRSRR